MKAQGPPGEGTGEPSDDVLVERAARGEAEAFGVLVRRYEGPLFNLMLRFCGGKRDLAKDMCQEAFLRAFKGLPGFRVGAPFRPWLYRVAINAFHSHTRRAVHRELGMDDVPEPSMSLGSTSGAAPPAADHQMRRSQDGAAVQAALLALPAPYREAVVLKIVEDFTYDEMAEILSTRVPALKMRVHRGLMRLRELLGGSEGGGP